MKNFDDFLKLACLMAVVCGGLSPSRAQTAGAEAAEAQAVRAAAQEYLTALRRGDANRLRSMWTPDGDYVNAAGQTLKAQELIARMAPAAETTSGSDPVDPPH